MRQQIVIGLVIGLVLGLVLVLILAIVCKPAGFRKTAGKGVGGNGVSPFTLWCEYPQTKDFDGYTSVLLKFLTDFPVKRLVMRVQNPKVFGAFRRQGSFFTKLMGSLPAGVEEVYILPWLGDPWDADADGYGFDDQELSEACRQQFSQQGTLANVLDFAVCWFSAANKVDSRIRGFLFEKEGAAGGINNQTVHDSLKAQFGDDFVDDLSSKIQMGTTDYTVGSAPYVHKIFPEMYNLCGLKQGCSVVDATSDKTLVCGSKAQPQFPDTIYTQAAASPSPTSFLVEKFSNLTKRCADDGDGWCATRVVPLFSVEIGPDPFKCTGFEIANPYRGKDFVTLTGNNGTLGTINAFGTFQDAEPALLAMQAVMQSLGYAEFGVFQFDLVPATWHKAGTPVTPLTPLTPVRVS